jgi:hypothetical protein
VDNAWRPVGGVREQRGLQFVVLLPVALLHMVLLRVLILVRVCGRLLPQVVLLLLVW